MDEFYDLGEEPSRLNDVGIPDKVRYPTLYIENIDSIPGIGDLKLKDEGKAEICFKVKNGNIEVRKIRVIGSTSDQERMDMSGESPKKPKTRNDPMGLMGGY